MSLVTQVSELIERGRLLRSLDDGFTRAELKPILDFADEHPATRQRCFDHLLGMLQGRPMLAFADERGFADNERRRAVVEEITARLATRDRRMTTLVNVASGQVLGVVDGRDSAAVQAWLGHRSQPWRDRIQIVAIDPSAAFRKAITTTLPVARIAVDPFHLVQLANLCLTRVRQRLVQEHQHRRGRKIDPCWAHRTLCNLLVLIQYRQSSQIKTSESAAG